MLGRKVLYRAAEMFVEKRVYFRSDCFIGTGTKVKDEG